jgi:hypothetical protein
MIKLVKLLVIGLLISSCSSSNYPTTPSTFVVSQIKPNKSSNGLCLYWVVPIDQKDLSMNPTWITDSIGKFKINDTIHFTK